MALAGVGWGGGVSTLLSQVAVGLPLGTVFFRTALVSALALAVASKATFDLALSMLRRAEVFDPSSEAPSGVAAPCLAAIATWTAMMTPSMQSEATVGGGVMVAVALCLFVCRSVVATAWDAAGDRPLKAFVVAALCLGSATAENAVAGALTAVAIAGALLVGDGKRGVLVPPRIFRWSAAAWVFGLALFSAPSLLRAMSPRAVFDFGALYLWGSVLPKEATAPALLDAWTTEVGWIALGMVGLGTAALVLGRRARLFLPLAAAPLLLDLALHDHVGVTEGTRAVRLLAFSWAACVTTAGVHAFFNRLVRVRIPMARAGAALVIAFQATIVALTVEEAQHHSNRQAMTGPRELTDVALERLPPRAALLVDDPAMMWRLVSARLVEGRRLDTLLVARPLLPRGDTAMQLLARERSTEPLVRAIALTGGADEFALNELADARPLFVELDRGWGDSEYSHVRVDGAWLKFEPEPLSVADRAGDAEKAFASMTPFLRAAASMVTADPDSNRMANRMATMHTKALMKSGDVKGANRYLAELDRETGARVGAAGSLDVAFAGAIARLPASRAEKDREKERAALRAAERKSKSARKEKPRK